MKSLILSCLICALNSKIAQKGKKLLEVTRTSESCSKSQKLPGTIGTGLIGSNTRNLGKKNKKRKQKQKQTAKFFTSPSSKKNTARFAWIGGVHFKTPRKNVFIIALICIIAEWQLQVSSKFRSLYIETEKGSYETSSSQPSLNWKLQRGHTYVCDASHRERLHHTDEKIRQISENFYV